MEKGSKMKLSLSGRLVECSGENLLSTGEFLDLAGLSGYDAVDLRASQLNPNTSGDDIDTIRKGLERNHLNLFEAAYRGSLAGDASETFARFAGLVADFGGEGIRISGDAATLKQAARLAAPHGIRILYQMHTGGTFETVASAARAVADIAEPNFGVMPEPANLMMAGETFGETMFEALRGHIFGVHVQTLIMRPDAKQSLMLAGGTEIRYERVPYQKNQQTDFPTFFAALRQVGFDGFVNELEPAPAPEQVEATARSAATFLRPMLNASR